MKTILFLVLLICSCTFIFAQNRNKATQEKLPGNQNFAVVYDNDDHRDVYTDEYLMALASIGEIDLKGIITTYSPSEYGKFVEGRSQILELARKSGLQNLPEIWPGTNKKLVRPVSNKIEDTVPLKIEGSDLIAELAMQCSPEKPLVIISGGQLTTIANAYLVNPLIAENVQVTGVFGAEKMDYNAGLDAWAWAIILSKFRVFAIPIGPPGNRGKVYMNAPAVPKARIKNELDLNIPIFRWMYGKKHPSNNLPDEHDFDGQPAILITQPEYVTQWKKLQCLEINEKGYPVLEENELGKIWQAGDASQEMATSEFWRVMDLLQTKLKNNRQK